MPTDTSAGSKIMKDVVLRDASGTAATFNGGLIQTEPLGQPAIARQLAAGAASTNTALTTTITRISIYAETAAIRFIVGTGSQTANASTSHFIASGERLDFRVPLLANIAVIRHAATDGTLHVTELT